MTFWLFNPVFARPQEVHLPLESLAAGTERRTIRILASSGTSTVRVSSLSFSTSSVSGTSGSRTSRRASRRWLVELALQDYDFLREGGWRAGLYLSCVHANLIWEKCLLGGGMFLREIGRLPRFDPPPWGGGVSGSCGSLWGDPVRHGAALSVGNACWVFLCRV
jgi:hypothetical protein